MRRSIRIVAVVAVVSVLVGFSAEAASASTDVGIRSEPRTFSPNGDGQEDTLTIEFCPSAAANFDISVLNASSSLVRLLEAGVSHPAGCHYVEWDGRNSGGALVANGAYSVRFQATGATGAASETYQTRVDNRLPGALTQPVPGATISGVAGFVFTPTAGFGGINYVYVSCLGSSGVAEPDGTFRAEADTTACGDGSTPIAAYVLFADVLGGSHFWISPERTVNFDNAVRVEFSGSSPPATFSPNGDGTEDTVTPGFCISRAATMDIVVRNSANAAIRTLASAQPAHPVAVPSGSCAANSQGDSIAWDGQTDANSPAPAGDYTINVQVQDTNGSTADVSYQTAIDRRLPGVLTQPAAGTTISGSRPFTFTPTAGFPALSSVQTCLGQGTEQLNGTWTGTGDSGDCGFGAGTSIGANVQWIDKFGWYHSWSSQPNTVTVDNPLVLTESNTPRSFSPNGDGQEDSTTVDYCLNHGADVTIQVRNGANTVVRTLESGVARTPGCGTNWYTSNGVTWDGQTDASAPAAAGAYSIRVTATDSLGHSQTVSVPTTVDTRVPGELTSPAAGSTLVGSVGFVFTPTPGFTGISAVDVACLGSASGPQPNGTWSGTGDITPCGSGPTDLNTTLIWVDSYGSAHSWSAPAVPVNIESLSLTQVASSRSFSPNGDGTEDDLSPTFCLSRGASVDAVVKNAANAVVRTISTAEAHPGGSCVWWNMDGISSVTWDGRNAGGVVVPDGNYSIVLHAASSGGITADLTIPTTVDSRTPAQLTSPLDGTTVGGLVPFRVVPVGGLDVTSASGCYASGGCVYSYNPSADGAWRSSISAATLAAGPTTFSWDVAFTDSFGQGHSWPGPSVAVTVDRSVPVLDAAATIASGPAPLVTGLAITALDNNGRPLDYTVDFGDSSALISGTLTNPYSLLSLPHTYPGPGVYAVHISVSNGAGGFAEKTVTITATGSGSAPVPALAMTPSSGIAPVTTSAAISATDADQDPLTYTVDFGDGTAVAAGSLPRGPLGHQYANAGTYTVRLAVSDGTYTSVRTRTVSVGLAEALRARAGDDQTAIIGDTVLFDGGGSRPLVGITSYSWNFGDGTTATGARASHVFGATGTKTVTLTVHAGTQTNVDQLNIQVQPVPIGPGVHVSVTDGSNPMAAADVLVLDASGVRHPTSTDNGGSATLDGLADGSYTVYAWHDGYRPGTGSVTVTGGTGAVTIALDAGAIAQTDLTSTRLDAQQITDLGIDPNDPANQNVFQFEIHLAFTDGDTTTPISFSGVTTGDGFINPVFSGGGGGGCPSGAVCTSVGDDVVYPVARLVGDNPTIVWMVIPGRAKWLKEFFDVRMLVTNLAGSSFTFQHGLATLGALPDGLSLAPTADPQTLDHALADIPGGESGTTDWVIRGDAEGLYTLTAQYTATVEPIGSAVRLDATTANGAVRVWGGSALRMHVRADSTATAGTPYRVSIGLENVSDIPIFNPSVELLETGRVNYIYQPGEQLFEGVGVIAPRATFWTHDFRLIPEISGTLDVAHSFQMKTAGNTTIPSEPVVPQTPATSYPVTAHVSPLSVDLAWDPPVGVSGITRYDVFYTPDRDTPFGPSPVATSTPAAQHASVTTPVPGFYAVATVVGGGRTMYHRLVAAGAAAPVGIDPSVSVSDTVLQEGDVNTTTAAVNVSLSWPSTKMVTLKYQTVAGSASAGADYQTLPLTALTFAPGQTNKTIMVTAISDLVAEPNETFALNLSSLVNATPGDASGVVTILDNDGVPTISVQDIKATEGSAATTAAAFTLTASQAPAPGHTITVKVATASGTATSGSDFTAVPLTTVTFAAGQTSKTVPVSIKGDATREGNEAFQLQLSGPVGATLADNAATAVVLANDGAPASAPAPYVMVSDKWVLEGNTGTRSVPITVRLSWAAATSVSVRLATVNGTATAGRDYQAIAPVTVTFAPGQVTKTVTAVVLGDSAREPNERFAVNLTSLVGAQAGDTSASVAIVDDDGPMSAAIHDAWAMEGDSGNTALTFLVTLPAPSVTGQTFTVSASTIAGGTATSGSDFTALAPLTVSFAPGQTSAQVTVLIHGDVGVEANERLLISIGSPVGMTIADTTATGYIINDD